MSKPSDNVVRIETWNVEDPTNQFGDKRKVINKIAVRNRLGQFHGATNFRGSRMGQ